MSEQLRDVVRGAVHELRREAEYPANSLATLRGLMRRQAAWLEEALEADVVPCLPEALENDLRGTRKLLMDAVSSGSGYYALVAAVKAATNKLDKLLHGAKPKTDHSTTPQWLGFSAYTDVVGADQWSATDLKRTPQELYDRLTDELRPAFDERVAWNAGRHTGHNGFYGLKVGDTIVERNTEGGVYTVVELTPTLVKAVCRVGTRDYITLDRFEAERRFEVAT